MEDVELDFEQLGADIMERMDRMEHGLQIMGMVLKEALERIDAVLAKRPANVTEENRSEQ